ncbi:MAG: hypothetical protein ACE14P_00255 [Methanotrichaceae archaeon]
MLVSNYKIALVCIVCLVGILSNATAVVSPDQPISACSPVIQNPVAPGDEIDLKGPDVPADQKELGISWAYQWTVKENDASGKIVATQTGQTLAFVVPTSNPAANYYIDLMVTAEQATLCINEACMKFPIVAPGPCEIKTSQPQTVCISDTSNYGYSTVATPSQVNQRWWIFPLDSFPDPTKIGYNDQASYKIGDGSSISVVWNKIANGDSGTYVVYSAYYAKKSPYAYQGSCQMRINVVAVPSSTITIT